MENEKKPWFKPKSFGWGWQPNTWEGWVLSALYTVGLIRAAGKGASTRAFDEFLINFGLDFVILTTLFLVICYMTSKFPLKAPAVPPAPAPAPNNGDNETSQTQQ